MPIFLIFAQESDSLNDTLKLYMTSEVKTMIKPHHDRWFSQDKFLHFSVCASIVGLSYHTLVCRLNRDENQGKIYSISFTALIGLGKEIYDKKKKGHFSYKDLCWDGAGLVIGYFAFIHRY
jgi:uncharacterized protein YfiM (DUF2279 family)